MAREQGEQREVVEGIATLNAGLIDAATWEEVGLRCLGGLGLHLGMSDLLLLRTAGPADGPGRRAA